VALAVPGDPGESDDLAGRHVEADVVEAVPHHTLDDEPGPMAVRGPSLGREDRRHAAAHDEPEDVVIGDGFYKRTAPDHPVAQNRDAVGDLPDLGQAVRDIDDRRAAGSGSTNLLKQP